MRALLTQDALTRASEGAAALGLNAATQYGTVGANYSSVLERLTQMDSSVTDALLNALNVAKGAVTDSTTTGNSTTNTAGTQTTNQVGAQTVGGQTTVRNAGDVEQFSAPSAGGSLSGFSVSDRGIGDLTNAQWSALAKAAGGQVGWFNDDKWSGYKI
jgi:hypothetical protein